MLSICLRSCQIDEIPGKIFKTFGNIFGQPVLERARCTKVFAPHNVTLHIPMPDNAEAGDRT